MKLSQRIRDDGWVVHCRLPTVMATLNLTQSDVLRMADGRRTGKLDSATLSRWFRGLELPGLMTALYFERLLGVPLSHIWVLTRVDEDPAILETLFPEGE